MPGGSKATSNRERPRTWPAIQARVGVPPANKGRKLPAEALTPAETRDLLATFGQSPTGLRNRAIVLLMYRASFKVGEVVGLERRHYEVGGDSITRPPARYAARERTVPLSLDARSALDDWMAARKRARAAVSAPLFCTISEGTKGGRLQKSYVASFIRAHAEKAGIDRRVSSEGLRLSGVTHRDGERARSAHLAAYLQQEELRGRYPDAFAKWEAAVEQFELSPERYASRIGHDCREAMLVFADEALRRRALVAPRGSGTIDKLRLLLGIETRSEAVDEHLLALVGYWGATSDVTNRQEHAASRERESLTVVDAHRVVFHTILVMSEVDRAMASPSGREQPRVTPRSQRARRTRP